ncbi:MAG: lactate racemase domain-containing protein [Bacillota bacterium]|nr:lactate racemase domain-containing protein [Bacillota bacterium]
MEKLRLYQVKQIINNEKIFSVKDALRHELKDKKIGGLIRPGQKIAITVGSRGIASLAEIVSSLAEWLLGYGAKPFIVPAMGSHGNASARGQLEVLEGYGITEQQIGVPIVSSMEVIKIGETSSGSPVYCDKEAYNSDAIVVLNRVKPHTTMSGPVQSGLMKILAVGLGNHKGAESMHRHNLEKNVPEAAAVILKKAPVLFGVAIVGNALNKPYKFYAIPAERIEFEEPPILQEAIKILPVIPFDHIDVLLVRMMGKNISGSDMDTNVVGQWRRVGGEIDKNIKRIAVFQLSPESHGNAIGVGMADFITRSLYEKINLDETYKNALTAGWTNGAKIPMIMEDEKAVVEKVICGYDSEKLRLVFIEDTLNLHKFWVSEKIKDEAAASPRIDFISGPSEVCFSREGKLLLKEKVV